MKKIFQSVLFLGLIVSGTGIVSSFTDKAPPSFQFPYKKAGLTEREAAAHLLSRFTFGPTPGQIDEVVKMGLESWFQKQLEASNPDGKTKKMLAGLASLQMSNADIVKTYPRGGQVLRMAIRDGVVDKNYEKDDKKDGRQAIQSYMQKNGLKPQAELMRDLVAQKILRARYSSNQLHEVMVDFWFNHFNVAVSKGSVTQFVTAYERDAIRPNVLGNFEAILLATAKSPAMLNYLDNSKSSVNEEYMVDAQKKFANRRNEMIDTLASKMNNQEIKKGKAQGLNENYAREIMELHTLGVDGGYAQSDVTEAARILTGWSLHPEVEYNVKLKNLPNERRLKNMGFVIEEDFVFAANRHDFGEKKVLGKTFAAGNGYNEGLELIHMLATHKSTAAFISKKLATRFVSDNPSQALINKMSKTFLEKNGDIKEVMIAMVSSPEFWDKKNIREKTKSPFELAMSAVRTTGAEVVYPVQLYQWINKMGQKLYNYQAPTGFPDRGQYWINTGSLLNRMNFGLALSTGKIPGIKLNLAALNNNHEPESAEHALRVYSKILMPERDLEETIKRLTPLLNDPELAKKVDDAASKTDTAKSAEMNNEDVTMMEEKKVGKNKQNLQMQPDNNSMLGQVVGVIIGSPEFQRR